jgi:hypothetical protein
VASYQTSASQQPLPPSASNRVTSPTPVKSQLGSTRSPSVLSTASTHPTSGGVSLVRYFTCSYQTISTLLQSNASPAQRKQPLAPSKNPPPTAASTKKSITNSDDLRLFTGSLTLGKNVVCTFDMVSVPNSDHLSFRSQFSIVSQRPPVPYYHTYIPRTR